MAESRFGRERKAREREERGGDRGESDIGVVP